MALDKPIGAYIPGLPAGESVPADQIVVEAIAGVEGTTLQEVLEDIASRLAV